MSYIRRVGRQVNEILNPNNILAFSKDGGMTWPTIACGPRFVPDDLLEGVRQMVGPERVVSVLGNTAGVRVSINIMPGLPRYELRDVARLVGRALGDVVEVELHVIPRGQMDAPPVEVFAVAAPLPEQG